MHVMGAEERRGEERDREARPQEEIHDERVGDGSELVDLSDEHS